MSLLQIDAVDRRPVMPPNSLVLHPSGRILYVDDDRDFTGLVKEFLGAAGIEIDVCNDPLEVAALPEILGEDRPWWAGQILDFQMPGMDGVTLGTKVLTYHPKVPTMVLSAASEDGAVSRFRDQYGCEVKGKPFDVGEIIEWARRVMRSPAVVH